MASLIKTSIVNAIATSIYIILVASFIYSLQTTLPTNNPTIFIPIAMLMLFVFSAALTAFLVFGSPIMLYLDGKKKQALLLLTYTLGMFLIITVLIFFLLILFS